MRYLDELDNPDRLDECKAHLRQLHPFIGELALNEIRMDALQPFIRHRKDADGVPNASVNRALEIVRRILHLARDEWDWIDSFPRIRMLREPKRRVRFLTRQEADALLEALPAHLRPVVTFALATGCRMGEILDLEWTRVDLKPARRLAGAWHDQKRRGPRHPPEHGCHPRTESGRGRTRPLVFHVPRAAHGSRRIGMEACTQARADQRISVPRSAPHLGQLACDQRHVVAGADVARRVEVLRDGAALRASGTGSFESRRGAY